MQRISHEALQGTDNSGVFFLLLMIKVGFLSHSQCNNGDAFFPFINFISLISEIMQSLFYLF